MQVFMTYNMDRFGKDVKAAVSYNSQNRGRENHPTTAKTLAEDIINVPSHILGHHKDCNSYYCKTQGILSEEFIELCRNPAGKDLIQSFQRLATRSQRLIFNVTSNFAEFFMAVMSKNIGGKRINYAQRGSYTRRTFAAALSYDFGPFWLPRVFMDKSNIIWMNTEKTMLKTRSNKNKSKRLRRGPFKLSKTTTKKAKLEYGTEASQGMMSDEELAPSISILVKSLQKSPEEIALLERLTVGQSYNEDWKYERRNRITASNCGRINSLQAHTSNLSILKSLLYPTDLSGNENIRYGVNLEPEAKRMYTFLNGVEVAECGLFISEENGILAASPDGTLGEDGILEIKCITCPQNKFQNERTNS